MSNLDLSTIKVMRQCEGASENFSKIGRGHGRAGRQPSFGPPGVPSSTIPVDVTPGPSAEAVAESALAEVTRAGCYHGQQAVEG